MLGFRGVTCWKNWFLLENQHFEPENTPQKRRNINPNQQFLGFHVFVFGEFTLFFCLKPLKKGCDLLMFFLPWKAVSDWRIWCFLSYSSHGKIQSPNFQGENTFGTMLKLHVKLMSFFPTKKHLHNQRTDWLSFWWTTKSSFIFQGPHENHGVHPKGCQPLG